MTSNRFGTAAALAMGCALFNPVAAMAETSNVTFAAHRAIYELAIDTTSPGSGVSGIGGRIVYELTANAENKVTKGTDG